MSGSTFPRFRLSLFLFRLLLRGYPRVFRKRFTSQMVEDFRELLAQELSRGPVRGRVHAWVTVLLDVVVSLPSEHLHAWRDQQAVVAPKRPRQAGTVMDTILQDLRFALRTLRKRPLFATVATATLGLGIGASTAMFSVVDGVLLRPPSYRDPQRLVKIWQEQPSWEGREGLDRFWNHLGISYTQYRRWMEGQTLFESVAIFNSSEMSEMTLSGMGHAERLSVGVASASLLPTLGVHPALGRGFLPQEDASVSGQAAQVVLVGDAFWRARLGGDPNVLGTTLTLNGLPFQVVGVLPPGFRFLALLPVKSDVLGRQEVWIPLGNEPLGASPGPPMWDAIGRLAPGVTLEQATRETQAILQTEGGGRIVRLVPRKGEELTELNTPLLLLFAAAGVLLLIGCLNVATLSMAEVGGRLQELAIRSSLGARRGRIVRLLLTESAILGLIGSLAGVVVAILGTRALVALAPPIPRLDQVGVDLRVLAFGVVLGLVSGVAFGTLPALLATGGRSPRFGADVQSGRSGRYVGLQRALVGAEITLTVVLLVMGGLLGRSLSNLVAVDPGFDPQCLSTAVVTLPEMGPGGPESALAFMREVMREIHRIPGVERASLGSDFPIPADRIHPYGLTFPGQEGSGGRRNPDAIRVWPGYHETLGIPLREGRTFSETDGPDSPRVLMVSELAARRYWPGASPVGATVNVEGVATTVVGVVGDVKKVSLTAPVSPTIYLPLTQYPTELLRLAVRGETDPARLMASVREAVGRTDPGVPVSKEATMEALVSWSAREEQYRAALVVVFGILATVLAATGIFGITARGVAHRARELGVRMALGARGDRLLVQTLNDSLRIGFLGVVGGVLLSFWASNLLAGYLFGVETSDPLTYAAAVLLAMVVCGAAALIPARRVTAVDPARVLREE